ncbi:MAG: hypothetical protein KKC76_17105 [Proteobacteria bacterium]|nr:hypothetical protein [Pseudomonadota bacterium]MBU4294655.1 hypothetical protein [Pseudomonadota bacterium]MCG2748878.1 hypothetical protein [Desulfobulbaceae bacterium]
MKYQYISKNCPPEEKTWLCADCRETNIEKIQAGRWQLVGVSTDSTILCEACDHTEQLVNRPAAAFAAIRSFLLTLH